jgi:DNA-binding MarR family transcriptional regulator
MASAPPKPELRIPITGLWGAALQAFLVEFRAELGQTEFDDIRPTHGCVFRFIREGDGMRLTRLAELAGITKQSAGEIVDDLVKSGYVARIADPADKRAKLICLTEKGVGAQATGFGLFATIEKAWIERYGEERMTQMRDLLEEIVATEAPGSVPELQRAELADAL